MNFVHMRVRSQFGKQPLFSDRGPEILDSFPPNKRDFEAYILKDPVHTASQAGFTFAEHVVNTSRAKTSTNSMNHTEGGWPKDINCLDPEATGRFKRKTEKEEVFNRVVNNLCKNVERIITQNNAINIYGKYFEECEQVEPVEKVRTRTINVYRDQEDPKRPISHLSWAPGGCTFAAAHCNTVFQYPNRKSLSNNCYIWDLENPNVPLEVLSPDIPMVILEYNHKDHTMLAGGMINGQITAWDARTVTSPIFLTPRETSHREPLSALIWINSKSGTEFFTCSTDGAVQWWDMRKLEKPTECLIVDVVKPDEQNRGRALGLTALEYEPTIPTRYIMASDMGMIVGGNRKGKLPSEKIIYKFPAANGPIFKIERNPSFAKNILAISGFEAKIWFEDCRESAIILTKPKHYQYLDGAWSPTKFSTFFVTRTDGTMDIWNILNTQKVPTISVKVSPDPLRKIRVHDNGSLITVGNEGGTAFLLQLSGNLTRNQKDDKHLLTAMFDREARREKILEGRIREIKLKVKTDAEKAAEEAERRAADPRMEGRSEDSIEPLTSLTSAEGPLIGEAEADYFAAVEKERAIRKPKVEEVEEEEEEEEQENEDEF